MDEPDKEEFDEYLYTFESCNWSRAVSDDDLLRLLLNFFANSKLWEVNDPRIVSVQVLDNLVFDFQALPPLSKLEFTLCFPYIKIPQNPNFYNLLNIVAAAVFRNADAITREIVAEFQPMLRDSLLTERTVNLKLRHLDSILTTPNVIGQFSDTFINALKNVQLGLHNMMAEIRYEREEDAAVNGILSGSFDDELFGPDGYDAAHANDLFAGDLDLFGVDTGDFHAPLLNEQELEEERQKAEHFKLTKSMQRLSHTKLKKEKAQHIIEVQNKANEAVGVERIKQIIHREATNYRMGLSLENLNAQLFEEQPRQKNLAQMLRAESNAAKAARKPASPDLISTVGKSSITEPTCVRLRGGGSAIMHPSPMVKQAVERHLNDMKNRQMNRTAENARLPVGGSTRNIVGNSSTTKTYVKVTTGTGKNATTVAKLIPVEQLPRTKFPIQRPTPANNYTMLPRTLTKIPPSEREDEKKEKRPPQIQNVVASQYTKIIRNGKIVFVKKSAQAPVVQKQYKLASPNKYYTNAAVSFPKRIVPFVQKGQTVLCRPYTTSQGQTVLRMIQQPTPQGPSNRFIPPVTYRKLQVKRNETPQSIRQTHYRTPQNYQQPSTSDARNNTFIISDEMLGTDLHQNDPIQQVAHEEVIEDVTEHIQHVESVPQYEYHPVQSEGAVVHYEEIQDTGEIKFRPPRDDDLVFNAEEIDKELNAARQQNENVYYRDENVTVVPNPYNIMEGEYEELQETYPDLFGPMVKLDDDVKFMMAAFMFGRLDNPSPDEGTAFNIKVDEVTKPITIDDFATKQVIELYFEMSYDTMLWTRVRRTQVFRKDGVQTTIETLDLQRSNEENEVYLNINVD